MRSTATWRWLGAGASLALAASLWLPWFHGVDDSGPYSLTGWESFEAADIGLVIGCAVAALCLAISAPVTRRVLAAPLLVGVVSVVFAGGEALSGHPDHDPTADLPSAGVFVALASGLILAIAAQRLRTTFRPRDSSPAKDGSGKGAGPA